MPKTSENGDNGFDETSFNAYCMTFLMKDGFVDYFLNGDPLSKWDIMLSELLTDKDINDPKRRHQAVGFLDEKTVNKN